VAVALVTLSCSFEVDTRTGVQLSGANWTPPTTHWKISG
jgi:hypothetical protein